MILVVLDGEVLMENPVRSTILVTWLQEKYFCDISTLLLRLNQISCDLLYFLVY